MRKERSFPMRPWLLVTLSGTSPAQFKPVARVPIASRISPSARMKLRLKPQVLRSTSSQELHWFSTRTRLWTSRWRLVVWPRWWMSPRTPRWSIPATRKFRLSLTRDACQNSRLVQLATCSQSPFRRRASANWDPGKQVSPRASVTPLTGDAFVQTTSWLTVRITTSRASPALRSRWTTPTSFRKYV